MKEKKRISKEESLEDITCASHPLVCPSVSPFPIHGISGTNKQIPKRLLTIKEAGLYLSRSPWTIGEMIRSGRLPYVRDGKRRFLDIHDINSWIEKSKRKDDER